MRIQISPAEYDSQQMTGEHVAQAVGAIEEDGFVVLGVPEADVPRAVTAYRAHYAAGALLDVAVHDGVPDLLSVLRARGATLAVATSKPEVFAVRVLEHTGLLASFASVHGATMDGAVRHKDEVVGAALAAHPAGERPVLVGDRSHDVLGARAHGLPCIGAGWGPALPGELVEAGAAAVVDTPAEVPAAVAALGPGWWSARG